MQNAVSTDVEVILAGFKAADAEQSAGEAEHIHTALVVVVFTGEQSLHSVGTVEGLRVGNDAAEQCDQLISVPCGILSDEQVGTLGAIIAVVGSINVSPEHIDSGYTVKGTGCVHGSNNVAGSIIVFGNSLNACAVQRDNIHIDLAFSGHVRLVNSSCKFLAGVGTELAFTVKQLLDPVNTHQRHTLDVVDTIKVRAEINSAGIHVAGDGKADNGIRFQIGAEIRHLIQIFGYVDNSAVFTVL